MGKIIFVFFTISMIGNVSKRN